MNEMTGKILGELEQRVKGPAVRKPLTISLVADKERGTNEEKEKE